MRLNNLFAGLVLSIASMTGQAGPATLVAYQNTFSIPPANGARMGIIENFLMPQFDPTLGTLQSVDVTISGDEVTYYGVNSNPVYDASANVSLSIGMFGLSVGDLKRSIYFFPNPVTTISGTFAAAQNTQVNNAALWGFPVLDLYIGTSTIDGVVGLAEVVGYQSGNSYHWFDVTQSFGSTRFSVEIDYNYTLELQVPEPATMLLLGTGLAGLAGTKIRRKECHPSGLPHEKRNRGQTTFFQRKKADLD